MANYVFQLDFTSHDTAHCFCTTCFKNRIDTRVDHKVQRYIPNYLPEAMRNFLNNDASSRRIFDDHLKRVESQVESTGRQVIDRLVREDKYKTVNAALIEDFKRNSAADMEQLKSDNTFLKCSIFCCWWCGSLLALQTLKKYGILSHV